MNDELRIEPKTLARLLESGYRDLVAVAERLGGDKAEWRPLGKGRSTMSQLCETAERAELLIDLIDRRATKVELSPENWARRYPTFEIVVAANLAKASELSDKVGNLTREDLAERGAQGQTLASLLLGAYWNASYHQGQISYIEALSEAG